MALKIVLRYSRHICVDSATGLAVSARDPNNQAIYPIKKPKNIFDLDTESINHSATTVFNDIMDICGLEPGKKCDPSKSSMQHILMLTDADIDGDMIAITVACLIAKHCPQLIDAGMVGRIIPPAYSVPIEGSKKKKFVMSKREFFDIFMDKFSKDNKVEFRGKQMTSKELRAFLEKNFDYDKFLDSLADAKCIGPRLMEYIAWKYHGDHTTQKKSYWQTALKQYPGLEIQNEGPDAQHQEVVINGDVPGEEFIHICFNEQMNRELWAFKNIQKMNSEIYGYTINGKKDKSLYDVMHLLRSYIPSGVKRFKGLGELNVKDLAELCMNRDTRTVIIFKFGEDREKDFAKINLIMSTKAEWTKARVDLLSKLSINNADLDT